jgi:hypothetical protein
LTNIIFIAYQFAPLNAGGTFRSLYFVKYLRQFGINPIVLTLDPDSFSLVYSHYQLDPDLLKEIPEEIDVRYIPSENILQLYDNFFKSFYNIYFDVYSGNEASKWENALLKEVEKVYLQYKPQAVFLTVPPFSMLKIGNAIAKKYNLPLILDFRDPWLTWRTIPFGSYFHYLCTKKLEEKYLRESAVIITTSDQTIADFKKFHPAIEKTKFRLITNGYDETINDWNFKVTVSKTEEITIGYAGSFYYNPNARKQMLSPWYKKKINRIIQYTLQREDWLYRSPYFFFAAIRRLFEIRPDFGRRIKIKFIGQTPSWITGMADEFGLGSVCTFLGQKQRSESLAFQKQCDYLLITSSKVLSGDDYSIAGKTFEYFSMRKPIIAFVAAGAQKRIIFNSGTGVICDPDKINESAENLVKLFDDETILIPNVEFLDSLHRKRLTEKLAAVIHEIC